MRTFTSPAYWVSDRGSHFINETMQELSSKFRIEHKPTVSYSPWYNGTVEWLMQDVLAALCTMVSEENLAPNV